MSSLALSSIFRLSKYFSKFRYSGFAFELSFGNCVILDSNEICRKTIHEVGHITVIEIIEKLNHKNNNVIIFDIKDNITVNKILNKALNKIGVDDIKEKE